MIKHIIGAGLAVLLFCGLTFALVWMNRELAGGKWRYGIAITMFTYVVTGILLGLTCLTVWLLI